MAKGASKLMIVLYIIAAIIAAVGVYILTIDQFIGIGMIIVAIALFIMPMTRPRY